MALILSFLFSTIIVTGTTTDWSAVKTELQAKQALFNGNNYDEYVFSARITCHCTLCRTTKKYITVKSDETIDITFDDNTDSCDDSSLYDDDYRTINDWFNVAIAYVDQYSACDGIETVTPKGDSCNDKSLTVTYDDTYNYPLTIIFDVDAMAYDGGSQWQFECFDAYSSELKIDPPTNYKKTCSFTATFPVLTPSPVEVECDCMDDACSDIKCDDATCVLDCCDPIWTDSNGNDVTDRCTNKVSPSPTEPPVEVECDCIDDACSDVECDDATCTLDCCDAVWTDSNGDDVTDRCPTTSTSTNIWDDIKAELIEHQTTFAIDFNEYVYSSQRSCFCTECSVTKKYITVINDETSDVTFEENDSGCSENDLYEDDYYTINDWFNKGIEYCDTYRHCGEEDDEILSDTTAAPWDDDCHDRSLDVTYDDTYGYPIEIIFDQDAMAYDGGSAYYFECFDPYTDGTKVDTPNDYERLCDITDPPIFGSGAKPLMPNLFVIAVTIVVFIIH